MISGVHAIIYSKQAERLREFFGEVLQYPSVDAGGGWEIFALPPAELAMHPAEDSYHELYLMCDDVHAATKKLQSKGVELAMPISDRGWGLVTRLKLPSGDQIGLYQPKHPTALDLRSPRKSRSRRSKAARSRRAVATKSGQAKKRKSKARR
jgi:predicted enzyme related to lactoylglutathione lyase